jgi:hypothetical protein
MLSLSKHEAVLTTLACARRASSFDKLRMRRSADIPAQPLPPNPIPFYAHPRITWEAA